MRSRTSPLKAFVKKEEASPIKGKLKPCQKAAAKKKPAAKKKGRPKKSK